MFSKKIVKAKHSNIHNILYDGLTPVLRKIYRKHINNMVNHLYDSIPNIKKNTNEPNNVIYLTIINDFYTQIDQILKQIKLYNKQFTEFEQHHQKAKNHTESKKAILDYMRKMGDSKTQIMNYRRAFHRWFDINAVFDKYNKIISDKEQYLNFLLNRLGNTAKKLNFLDKQLNMSDIKLLEANMLRELLYYNNSLHTQKEVLLCLQCIFETYINNCNKQQAHIEKLIPNDILEHIHKTATNRHTSVWVEIAAINLCIAISSKNVLPDVKYEILNERFQNVIDDNVDFFVRYNIVHHIIIIVLKENKLRNILDKIIHDPSAYVRQKLAYEIKNLPVKISYPIIKLLLQDKSIAVRAAMLLTFKDIITKNNENDNVKIKVINLFKDCFKNESNVYLLRVLLHVSVSIIIKLSEIGLYDHAKKWSDIIEDEIENLCQNSSSIAVKRFATVAREHIFIYKEKWRHDYFKLVKDNWLKFPLEKKVTYTLPKNLENMGDKENNKNKEGNIFRIISAISANDFGFCVDTSKRKWKIVRWCKFQVQLWRIIYEFFHPSINKRQGVSHCIASQYPGNIYIASNCLGQESDTNIPGEQLFFPSESSSREFIPLPGLIISSLHFIAKKTVKLYSSQGITELTPPKNIWKRLKAYLKLTVNYQHYANLRNYKEEDSFAPNQYIKDIISLGFSVNFYSYCDAQNEHYKIDKSVSKFFPAIAPPAVIVVWDEFSEYFTSLYRNNIANLLTFIAIIGSYFFIKHSISGYRIKKMRKKIPLTIGGWGTRGKSGTEHLKIALMEAIDLNTISKVTGCITMLCYSNNAHSETKEIPFFRAFDKATIWEQIKLLKIASKLKVDVLLWECMALNPKYAHIMQHKWIQDDIVTLTNTYSDHEDIQGPSGTDVTKTLANFIPKHSMLITSEEQMVPILDNTARLLNTECFHVNWLQAGLITDDIIARFPYKEHPYNIALVMKLAEQFNLNESFAFKAMADNVTLDIGALRSFSVAKLYDRKVEFTNGFSANEKLSTMSNWVTMQFDKQNIEATPHIWTATIVNNREDRAARSKTFASMIVDDLTVDRHYIVGTNLRGLLHYIKKFWKEKFHQTDLWFNDNPQIICKQYAVQYNLITNKEIAIKRLNAMFDGLNIQLDQDDLSQIWDDASSYFKSSAKIDISSKSQDSIINYIAYMKLEIKSFVDMLAIMSDNNLSKKEINKQFQQMLWNSFSSKLVFIDNLHMTTGNVLHKIVQDIPPGLNARIMGIQNIKNIGLDLINYFQDWEHCNDLCQKALSQNKNLTKKHLKTMSEFTNYNILCKDKVNEVITITKEQNNNDDDDDDDEIDLYLNEIKSKLKAKLDQHKIIAHGIAYYMLYLFRPLIIMIAAIADIADSVRRTKTTTKLYNDWTNHLISNERLMQEVTKLNERQKKGWWQNKIIQILHFGESH